MTVGMLVLISVCLLLFVAGVWAVATIMGAGKLERDLEATGRYWKKDLGNGVECHFVDTDFRPEDIEYSLPIPPELHTSHVNRVFTEKEQNLDRLRNESNAKGKESNGSKNGKSQAGH